MDKKRIGDQATEHPVEYPRHSRGFEVNGQWYFEVRGGGQKGPFDSELQMQAELNEFIYYQTRMNQQSPTAD